VPHDGHIGMGSLQAMFPDLGPAGQILFTLKDE